MAQETTGSGLRGFRHPLSKWLAFQGFSVIVAALVCIVVVPSYIRW
jgi:hypothetical protein